MKTLYLLRHAKSSWDDRSLSDRERPLEARGERDAARMGKRWAHLHRKPELIVSSPAVRALATARLVAAELGCRISKVAVDERLHAATMEGLITVIEALDDRLERVMLVGHNPGLVELAQHFDGGIQRLPTCALALFMFDAGSWAGIGQARPARAIFDSPRHSRR